MARIFAYCDSPTAPTGFGRSALHILGALHKDGHEIVQLAVNHQPGSEARIPWKVYAPTTPGGADPYGFADLARVLTTEQPFDAVWTTFDPQCPFAEQVRGVQPPATVLQFLTGLRRTNPGLKMLGWFPIDGGPLSDFELGVLIGDSFDVRATMATHVHDIVHKSLKLRGQTPKPGWVEERLEVVPHGVDLSFYHVSDEAARRKAKKALGFAEDCFLIVQVERNQPRKLPYLGLELLDRVRRMAGGERAFLYQHMAPDEETTGCRMGFVMPELAFRYGLKPGVDVRWIPGRPFTDAEMVAVTYAAADVVFSGSSGEGFQYPLWEALACGRRVLAPDDSARGAWLRHAPGAFLYKSERESLIMRGGYNRRMNRPDVADAASIVRKMLDNRAKFSEQSEASRGFVKRHADLPVIQKWWVDKVREQLGKLAEERVARQVTVRDQSDRVVNLRGFDAARLLRSAAALRAYKAAAEAAGERVCLALGPNAGIELARWLDLGHVYQCQPGIPLEQLGRSIADLSLTGKPVEPKDVASSLGIEAGAVAPDLSVGPPPGVAEKAVERLVGVHGVNPAQAVLLALDGLQEALVVSLADRLARSGLVPVIVGGRKVNCQRVNILNLSAATDSQGAIGLTAACGAVVADGASAVADFAAAMGRPLVAVGVKPFTPGNTVELPSFSAVAIERALQDLVPGFTAGEAVEA